MCLYDLGERGFEFLLTRDLNKLEAQTHCSRRRFQVGALDRKSRVSWVGDNGDCFGVGHHLAQKLKPLSTKTTASKESDPGEIALRPIEAFDQAHLHRVVPDHKYDGNCLGCCLDWPNRRTVA